MSFNFPIRMRARRSSSTALVLFLGTVSLGASTTNAETVSRWDFADENLVVDEANVENANATITASGSSTFVSCATNCAASFSQLADLNVSAVTIPVVTTGIGEATIAFSTRTSGTASKYWRFQVDAGAGFVDVDPIIVENNGGGFLDHNYSLAAFGQDVVAVRLVATDSVGDGSGDFVQADDVGTPSTAGTLRLDDILVEGIRLLDDGGIPIEPDAGVDAGVDGGQGDLDGGPVDGGLADGGPVDAGPPIVDVLIVSEIFFNVFSGSDIGKEWVEIENTSGGDVPLDGVTIESTKNITPVVERTHTFSGTNVVIPSGGRIVIAHDAGLGLDVCFDAVVVVVPDSEFSFSQSASTQKVRIFAPAANGVPAFDFTLQYKGGDAPETAATNGASLSSDVDGNTSVETECSYADAAFGTPGLAPGACVGEFVCPDAGTPEPGPNPGVEPAVDPEPLPPNTAPEITLENIVGGGGTAVTIRFSASDLEDGNEVEVSLFYDLDDTGFDGVLIERGLNGGNSQTFLWDLEGAPAGTYRVFGRVTDSRGASAYAYASGAVQVGGEEGAVATLSVIEPDGVNDAREDGAFLISWEAVLPPGTTGSVSIFYDTDDADFDGIPIAAGLAIAGEGATLLWEPIDVAEGSYAIYAVLNWTGGEVSAYGSFIKIGPVGCGCTQVQPASALSGSNNQTDLLNGQSTTPINSVNDLLCALCIAILAFGLLRPKRKRAGAGSFKGLSSAADDSLC